MSNDILILRLKDAASRVSYFNAAEGSWSAETQARNAARAELDAAREACIKAGIDIKPHLAGYLI